MSRQTGVGRTTLHTHGVRAHESTDIESPRCLHVRLIWSKGA